VSHVPSVIHSDPTQALKALQDELRRTDDIGDIIPEESRQVQDGRVLSSYDEEFMESVAYALVQADLVAEPDATDGERFRSTEQALESAGIAQPQFLQMSQTQRFKEIYRRVAGVFFRDLRYGRILKAASAAAMNGNVTAMKMVMTDESGESDAVAAKLEEIEAGGSVAFTRAISDLMERLRRLTDRSEVRVGTEEQLASAQGRAAERDSNEQQSVAVDHRELFRGTMAPKPDGEG